MKRVGKKKKSGCDCGWGDCGDCDSKKKMGVKMSPSCNQRVGKSFKQCTTTVGEERPSQPSAIKPNQVVHPVNPQFADSDGRKDNSGGGGTGDNDGDNDGNDGGNGGGGISEQDLLDQMDTDGDGYISSQEWRAWRDAINELIENGEYDPLYDVNGDGVVDEADRTAGRQVAQDNAGGPGQEEPLTGPDRLVKGNLLTPMDVNEYVKKRSKVVNKRRVGKKQKYSAPTGFTSDPGGGSGGSPAPPSSGGG